MESALTKLNDALVKLIIIRDRLLEERTRAKSGTTTPSYLQPNVPWASSLPPKVTGVSSSYTSSAGTGTSRPTYPLKSAEIARVLASLQLHVQRLNIRRTQANPWIY